MSRATLVLFEGERVCHDALIHAREYSLRMELEVALLMLAVLPPQDQRSVSHQRNAIQTLERTAGRLLSELSRDFLSHGIPVSVTLRIGDPAVELLRFLAERPPFREIVWGSDPAIPARDESGAPHWIARVSPTLECPLYSVNARIPDTDRKSRT